MTTERNRLGTFGGVFTPSILTILGAIMFLRASFVVGHAGIVNALLILLVAKTITFLTTLSVSAVSTNTPVRGGGAYFMISRVLGPEFGGAIGIALYFAQALSVPFYILALTEAVISTVPALAPHSLAVMLVTAALLFGVSYVGAGWAIKTQYVIMTILGLAIAAFLGGALLRMSPATLRANLPPAGDPAFPFWIVFAIYFPAVTGILAGINMSGDLDEPARSIPRGTFAAVGVGLLVYAVQIVVTGAAFPRDALIAEPYDVLRLHALFGAGFLVAAGVVAATLSSALGSYLGAPRILQALARDRIVPGLGFFAAGSRRGDEPRRGLLLTGLMAVAVLVVAHRAGDKALNAVAAVITMFFLCTYGMINFAAFVEGVGLNPSFRPRFRLFHWSAALLGAAGCLGAALLIDTRASIVAVAVIGALFALIARRQLKAGFGDARRGYLFTRVRRSLLRLARMRDDPRNWRPTVLVFSGNPNARQALVTYAKWIEGGRGIVYLASILTGAAEKLAAPRRAAVRQLEAFCREHELDAFPVAMVADSVADGVQALLQTTSLGPIAPNMAAFGWPPGEGKLVEYLTNLRIARQMGMSTILLSASDASPPGLHPRIDIWWRGQRNGGLMVLLAYMMQQSWTWKRSYVRVLRVVANEAGREPSLEAMRTLLGEARVTAQPICIVDGRPFPDVLRERSSDADCVLLGYELPDEENRDAWYATWSRALENMPSVLLVNSTGREDLMA